MWQVYCDGSWTATGAGAAAVIISPSGMRSAYAVKIDFPSTNNIAEYEAVLLALRKLKAMGARRAVLNSDSQVITGHIDKTYKARDQMLDKYLQTVRRMESQFEGFSVKKVERSKVDEADTLAKAASEGAPMPPEVFFEVLRAPAVELLERAVLSISPVHSEDWRSEIIAYLNNSYVNDDEAWISRMALRSRQYKLINGDLYKQGVCAPLLKCLSRAEGKDLMKEIHSGTCGSHMGPRSLLGKTFRMGFYWPKAASDAEEIVRTCDNCQRMAKHQRQPCNFTQLIEPTWPLQRWGMDIIGPMPVAQGNLKYAVVAVEYFSKWIEAKPLTTITSATIQRFFWQNIVCRFGVPRALTVDNGTQFDSEAFRNFCSQIGTKLHFASVRHPESNGAVERANGIILYGISKGLVGLPKGKWVEEMTKVTWCHNTSVSRATGFTPFKLLFGEEAMTPEELNHSSFRASRPEAQGASEVKDYDEAVAKDTVEEIRLKAVDNIRKYQDETRKWRDRKVKLKHIEPGHFVLRRVANPETQGKLNSKWEGPFLVKSSSRTGAFRLEDLDGTEVPRSWNASDLRRYYL